MDQRPAFLLAVFAQRISNRRRFQQPLIHATCAQARFRVYLGARDTACVVASVTLCPQFGMTDSRRNGTVKTAVDQNECLTTAARRRILIAWKLEKSL